MEAQTKEVVPVKRTFDDLVNDEEAIRQMLEETGGEVTEETEKIIDLWMKENSELKQRKIDGIYMFIQSLDAEAEKLDKVIKDLTSAKKQAENQAEFFLNKIKFHMVTAKIQEMPGTLFTFKVSEGGEKMNIDPALLPAKYQKEEISFTTDRAQIEADIAKGEKIPGVTMEIVYKLRKSAIKIAAPKKKKTKVEAAKEVKQIEGSVVQ